MPWKQMMLRGTLVFARCDERGELVAEGGRVEIRYKRAGTKAYQAAARNLEPSDDATVHPDEHCGDAEAAAPSTKKKAGSKKAGSSKTSSSPTPHQEGAIIVYADGACSGNPGPAGLGVVILDGDAREELSEYLGRGTNNIAELTGILRAAEKLSGRDAPIRIYTDSQYSIGVLTKGWKAKKNQELIRDIEAALDGLPDVKIHYVPGHAGHALNERADELARAAIVAEATSGWVRARP
ncbi:MAG: ribonuclease HI [Sandaracinaceae bacterium]|nr:ribonuclease HI [Sandaracinaceae bacterium]